MCKTLGFIPNIKENNPSHHTQDGYHHQENKTPEILARKQRGKEPLYIVVGDSISITPIVTYMEID